MFRGALVVPLVCVVWFSCDCGLLFGGLLCCFVLGVFGLGVCLLFGKLVWWYCCGFWWFGFALRCGLWFVCYRLAVVVYC